MVKCVMFVVLMLYVFYVNALPTGSRVRRGFNNSGYGSDRGGGFFNQGSNEPDASVSSEDGEGCNNSGENYDSREKTYGRDDYNQNDRRSGGNRPR